jgi:hypothetical protein
VIKQTQAELHEARSIRHPAVEFDLQKAKVYLTIENQRCAKGIDLSDEQCEISRCAHRLESVSECTRARMAVSGPGSENAIPAARGSSEKD